MRNIINEINNIEKQANKIVNDAIETKKSMAQKLDAMLHELDNKSQAETAAQINQIETSKDASIETKKKLMNDNFKNSISELEKDYNENKDKYCNEIFNKIIGE